MEQEFRGAGANEIVGGQAIPAQTPEPVFAEARQIPPSDVPVGWKAKLERVGGVVAIVAILLGNIAKLLDGIKAILDKTFGDLPGIKLPPIPTGVLFLLVVIGYVILLWLLRRRAAVSRHRGALIGVALICVAAFGVNTWLLLRERLTHKTVDRIQSTWSDRLLDIQVEDPTGQYGGFRYTLTPNSDAYPDTWSTAQCIRAIVVSNPNLSSVAARIRSAFEFVLSQRVEDNQKIPRIGIGWVTIPDAYVGGAPMKVTRTEISAWVALAYSAALKSLAIWPNSTESTRAVETLRDLITDLILRQDKNSGSWGASYSPVVPQAQRVYSSALALWALIEARDLLQKQTIPDLDHSIYTGTEWLISVYRLGAGWNPEATIADDPDLYPALSAQVLFILKLSTGTDVARTLESNAKYVSARQEFPEFLRQCRKVPTKFPVENETQHTQQQKDSKLYGKEYLNVHFVEYPWSLASLETLKADPRLSGSQRRAAASLEGDYLAQLEDLERNLSSGMTYILSEHLIGLTYLEALRFGHAGVPFSVPIP